MYCSRCGTNNREGSKFCNNCGEKLTPPDVMCPACGAANPSKNAFCNNCGARLVPPAAARPESKSTVLPVKGLSLPTRTPPSLPVEPPTPRGDGAGEKGAEKEGTGQPSTPETGGAPETEPPFAGEVPDWLAQLRAAPPVEEEATETSSVSQDIPDWIRQLQTTEPEDKPTPPAQEPPGPVAPVSQETPSWVKKLEPTEPEERPAPPVEEPPARPPRVSEDMPSWVRKLEPIKPEESAEPSPSAPKPPVQPTGLPAWLEQPSEAWLPEQETTSASAPVLEEPLVPAPLSPTEEFPQTPPAEFGTAFPTAEREASEQVIGAVDQSGLPDWLRDLQPAEAAAPEAKAAPEGALEAQAATTAPPAPAGAGLPDWLLASTPGGQRPNLEELPEWLRAAMPIEKPAEAPSEELLAEPTTTTVPEASAAVQPIAPAPPIAAGDLEAEPLDAGTPLAGLRGVIPLAMAVAEPHMSVEKPPPGAAAEKDDGARIFEAILTEAPAEAEPVSARRPARARTMRPVIYLLLACAVIIPFFFPRGVAQSLLRISKTPAADVYDLIQTVPSNSTVLVAFDYDPSVAGEMNPLANAIVRHLMQRRIKIVALSTHETGPQIAQKILSSAAQDAKDYRYGSEYVNAGYIPGHEAGLANLAVGGLPATKDYEERRDLKQYPLAQSIRSANDVGLIVELAGSEQTLQWWMEQVQPRTPTHIVAAVSAAVEPKARVYLGSAQLAGLVSGVIGAAQYEILSNQPGQALASVNAQSAAQIVLILIILMGNVVHWLSRGGNPGSPRVRPEKAT